MPTAPVVPSDALVKIMIESHQVPQDTTASNLTARLIQRHLVHKSTTDATVMAELKKRHLLPPHARGRLSDDEWKSFQSV